MNHNQIEKNNMYEKLRVFFSKPGNSAIWATFTRLVSEIANFMSLTDTLKEYIQKHLAETHGLTQTKNEAFMAMVNMVVAKAHIAYVWALDCANEELAHIFDVQKSKFLGIAETKALALVKNVRDALNANIGSMESVQLTADDVKALDAAIAAYQSTLGTTGAAQSHKTEATQSIDGLIHAIDKSLLIIEKLLVSKYSASHANMVNEYLLNSSIDKLPTHHNGVSICVTDAITGAGIANATFALDGKTTVTDAEGLAEIIKVKPGTYYATILATTYASQSVKVVIERGKTVELEVKLSK